MPTRFHLPLSTPETLFLSHHAELRIRQRGIPEGLLREGLQGNLLGIETACRAMDQDKEPVALPIGPITAVLYPDRSIATVYWSLPSAPAMFRHIPTGVESHPLLGARTAYLELSTHNGIDTADVIRTLRETSRTWIAAATLANDKRPLRATCGAYCLIVCTWNGCPNLAAPIRYA
jgi:hypothetical protein